MIGESLVLTSEWVSKHLPEPRTQTNDDRENNICPITLRRSEDRLPGLIDSKLSFEKNNSKSRVTMLENQLTIVPEIPIDNPDGNKKKKTKQYNNCLAIILNELMFERKISTAQIVKETGIPWATISDWTNYKTTTQKVDDNLMKLARFFNVSVEYLCFGIGEPDPAYGDQDQE